jgi:hypothetical protein
MLVPASSPLRRFACAAGCALVAVLGLGRLVSAEEITFRREVMAVLSKAGCNQGTCHGNFNGKNGFRLSLRGQDPTFDFNSLLRDQFSRRLNLEQPDESLLLLKAVAAVPHGGGRRFRPDSPEYEILRQWIADGAHDVRDLPKLVKVEVSPREQFLVAPEHAVQLKVTATFADDTTRDVTRWALYTASNPIVEINAEGRVERAPGVRPRACRLPVERSEAEQLRRRAGARPAQKIANESVADMQRHGLCAARLSRSAGHSADGGRGPCVRRRQGGRQAIEAGRRAA